MTSCCAYGCTNRSSKKIPGVTFHKFPSNPRLRKLWINAVKRKNWEPSHCSQLCSDHFSEDQIDRTSKSCVRLRFNAVPTIFDFPPNIKKIVEKSAREQQVYKEHCKNSTNNNLEEVHTTFPIISCVSSQAVSPFIPISLAPDEPSSCLFVREVEEELETPKISNAEFEELKRRLEQSEQLLESYRKKIKCLQQQNRRFRTRLINMKHSIFVELKKRQYLSSDMNYADNNDSCMLDRHSIKIRDSSDSEEVDDNIEEYEKRKSLSSDMNYADSNDSCMLDRHSIKIRDSSDSEEVDDDIEAL